MLVSFFFLLFFSGFQNFQTNIFNINFYIYDETIHCFFEAIHFKIVILIIPATQAISYVCNLFLTLKPDLKERHKSFLKQKFSCKHVLSFARFPNYTYVISNCRYR